MLRSDKARNAFLQSGMSAPFLLDCGGGTLYEMSSCRKKRAADTTLLGRAEAGALRSRHGAANGMEAHPLQPRQRMGIHGVVSADAEQKC